MFGTCERSQFSNHALNMFWFVSTIFFESEVIFTHPLGLLSLFRPNFNFNLGVIRSIVSKPETKLPIAKGKSLILFAISAAQVSHWMTESHLFNMVFSIYFLTSCTLRSTSPSILLPPNRHVSKSIFTFWLNLDSFIDVHPSMSWLPSSGQSFFWITNFTGKPCKFLNESSGAIVFQNFDVDSHCSSATEDYQPDLECCCFVVFRVSFERSS